MGDVEQRSSAAKEAETMQQILKALTIEFKASEIRSNLSVIGAKSARLFERTLGAAKKTGQEQGIRLS